jgi:valyl-tRNA synthetase
MIRLQHCINEVTRALDAYRFDEAANRLYHFTWNEYCDWYIEFAKSALNDKESPAAAMTRATLAESFETLLRLLHPFMPFITEELWQVFPHEGESIMVASYPKVAPVPLAERDTEGIVEHIIMVITAIRAARNELNVPPSQRLKAGLRVIAPDYAEVLYRRGGTEITRLARLSEFDVKPDLIIPPAAVPFTTSAGEGFVLVEDVYLRKEQERLKKKIAEKKVEFDREDKKWNDPGFKKNAPTEVRTQNDLRRNELGQELFTLSEHLRKITSLLTERP